MNVIKTIILTIKVTNSLLYLSLSFLRNQEQELNFKQVDGLVTRNNSFFSISFKAMRNVIDIYKEIFLPAIHVRILVPCYNGNNEICSVF